MAKKKTIESNSETTTENAPSGVLITTPDTYIAQPSNTSRTTRTLHDLTIEMLSILNAIDADAESGNIGEIDPELEEQLQAIESQLPVKIDGYVHVIRELQGYAEECSAESKRLAARARAWDNKATWLKGRILNTMLTIGELKIKTARNTVSVCRNGGVLKLILPERVSDIPEEYLTSRTVIEPDSELIRQKLEAGEALGFASLAERGVHLKIS